MRRKKLRQPFTQRACAVPMNDAHTLPIRERGFIEEFVNALGGFLHRGADHVDLLSAAFGRLRRDRDVLPRHRCSFWRRCALDSADLVDGNLHPQRAGLDFGRGSIQPPQNHRFVEAADTDTRSSLKLISVHRSYGLGRHAQIGLRF